jgi:choline transport protein
MWWSFVVNVFFGILMLVTMLFCIGPLDDVLESGVPYLTLFLNTGSTRMALFLTILVFLLIAIGNVTCLATCSREVWAFSRDKGFPFSNWISRMNRKQSIPYNSVYLSSALAGVLCLINLGSSFAFNIIVSLILLAILSTYMLSIGCLIHRRLSGKPLPHARWSLGRFGLPINIFAFFYSGFVIVFACFPVSVPVTLDSANWAPLVWAGVIILAIVAYIVHGRTNYTPPVEFVEGKRGNEIGFQSVN